MNQKNGGDEGSAVFLCTGAKGSMIIFFDFDNYL